MIEIRITGTTPLEALASVTAFGMHCMKNQDVHAAATRVLETGRQSVQVGHSPGPHSRAGGTPCGGTCGARRTGKPYFSIGTPGKPCAGPCGSCSGSWPPGDTPW